MESKSVEAWSVDESDGNSEAEEFMFDPQLLKNLNLSESEASFSPQLTIDNPGDGLRLRPLQSGDYIRGFLQLLCQLTKVGDVSQEQWRRRFRDMKNKTGTYHVIVLEDVIVNKIVGATTLVVEEKFIHACSQVRCWLMTIIVG